MTRQHVGSVEALVDAAAPRTYLVGELVRLGRQMGPRPATEPLRAWLERAHELRPHGRVRGRGADEVADPLGEPVETYRATAARLDALLGELADLIA
jgi:hypothetical protein